MKAELGAAGALRAAVDGLAVVAAKRASRATADAAADADAAAADATARAALAGDEEACCEAIASHALALLYFMAFELEGEALKQLSAGPPTLAGALAAQLPPVMLHFARALRSSRLLTSAGSASGSGCSSASRSRSGSVGDASAPAAPLGPSSDGSAGLVCTSPRGQRAAGAGSSSGGSAGSGRRRGSPSRSGGGGGGCWLAGSAAGAGAAGADALAHGLGVLHSLAAADRRCVRHSVSSA